MSPDVVVEQELTEDVKLLGQKLVGKVDGCVKDTEAMLAPKKKGGGGVNVGIKVEKK